VIRVAAASRGVTVVSIPIGRGLALLADVADRECRDGFSQPVIGRKHPVVAMPVLPRRRDEIGEPVEELKRREFDDTPESFAPGERLQIDRRVLIIRAPSVRPTGDFPAGSSGTDEELDR
jgi:hypothetical protein